MVLFVFQFYPVYHFGKFINNNKTTTKSYQVNNPSWFSPYPLDTDATGVKG